MCDGAEPCSLSRGHYEQQICETISNWDLCFRSIEEIPFKDISCLELLAAFIVWWSGTIYAILVEVITGNNSVKLFLIWTSGSRDVI